MDNDIKPTIVIDVGSGVTKAGLADNEYPSSTIPTVIFEDSSSADFLLGQEALEKENFSYPIDHGVVQNFDHIEKLLDHIFTKELYVRPEDHPVLITQPPKNPQRDKEKFAELLFDKFNVPALYEEVHSVLTFYSSGRSTGVIVESGHGVTTAVPILSGYAISEAILRLDVGGGDIDQYLAKLLNEKDISNNITPEEARKIKEKLCVVPELEKDMDDEESYMLPDGRTITLGKERFQATSPMFEPALVEQYDCFGIHEMIFQSIFKCGFDLRREFASNIILSGGNTLFHGIEDRLKSELEARVPASMKVNVIADKDRNVFVWRGGSILGSLSTFYKNICVSKEEYLEHGATIIRKKCNNGL